MIEAELIEDGGAAAVQAEFFRSAEFLAAEGVSHTLRIGDGESALAAPLLVRPIDDGDGRDASSPYGYPGLARTGDPAPLVDPAAVDFSATGLVSAFIRHGLGDEPPLAGATPRNVCLVSDPALPRKVRSSDRNRINKNVKKNGYRLEVVAGPDSTAEQRAGFLTAYTETMVHTRAAERYFFDAAYFDTLLASDLTWLVLARAADGQVAAGSIGARSDGYMHYYLSGMSDRDRRDSPLRNVLDTMIGFAAELDLPVNLGGGITPGDALEEFKRGFANREQQWFTSELVCDPDAYRRLTPAEPKPGFFPAYRS